jgi:C-terminal processing protease CtpA/Prc
MEFFDLGNLTACCTCARKDDSLQQSGQSEYYKRGDDKTGAAKVGRVEKPQLGGVGIVFQGTENGGLMVSSIMANGPAAASGLVQEGDLLISVNGVSIDGMTDREFN